MDCNKRHNDGSLEKGKAIQPQPMLSDREIEAMYARPTSKQNQIGIPINIPQTTTKVNLDKMQQSSTNNQNHSQEKTKLEENKATLPRVTIFHKKY